MISTKIEYLNTEIDKLKDTIRKLNAKSQEINDLQNSVEVLNKEIVILHMKNAELAGRLIVLEEDVKIDAEDAQKNKHMKHKCDTCKYSCKSLNTLAKHKNTKHPAVLQDNEKGCLEVIEKQYSDKEGEKETNLNDNTSISEKDIGLYEIEMVDGKVVIVCNHCEEGFDPEDDIEKHLKDVHNKIVGPNKWTSCLDRGCGLCNECSLDAYE